MMSARPSQLHALLIAQMMPSLGTLNADSLMD